MEETRAISRYASSSSSSLPTSSLLESETKEYAPPFSRNPGKKKLLKQLSMLETPRDVAWEKRRRRMFQKERNKSEDVTDEDMNELKGSIELGFGFKEEEGQKLCNTLPALDLYFAVNRQFYSSPSSPVSTPGSHGSDANSSSSPYLGDRSTSLGTLGTESGNNDS
ncbi:hypothetical protein Leryth_021490 [Lithospermum erythrorhizon]|nr:hypothetical protein Leryth_021490 [Lithospermum erythrorhizon]